MKAFYFIDENHQEQIDLIRLFQGCFDHTDLNIDDIIIAIRELEKHVEIKPID